MIALLRRSGFEVEELIEIRPPDGSTTRYPFITLEWAQRWPCEEAWKARKTDRGMPTRARHTKRSDAAASLTHRASRPPPSHAHFARKRCSHDPASRDVANRD
jgi:hypothetical protein